ncbi:hypothetical protein KIH13_15135 [Pseudomonas viridiflava]|nr:hypothetical protein KIH13_15135 [Pseudomonas viridiflava]
MSDLTSLSGSMGNLSSLPGVGGTSMGIGASLTGAGQGAQGGQSALQELAGMLAEMLLGSGSGSGSGSGAGGGSRPVKALRAGKAIWIRYCSRFRATGRTVTGRPRIPAPLAAAKRSC